MRKIFRSQAGRLSVAEAKRLILELPEVGAVDVFARTHDDGSMDFDGPLLLKRDPESEIGGVWLDDDVPLLFARLSIQPCHFVRPVITDFGPGSDPDQYTISHEEFVRLCGLFNVEVAITVSERVAAAPPPKAVQRQEAQDGAVLAKLVELGFSPKALPRPPKGKESVAKQAVKGALGYTKDVMNKAWQRLRDGGHIKYE